MTYRAIIYKLLQTSPCRRFKSWELVKTKTPYGWIGISGDRMARKMAKKGEILRTRGSDGYAEFFLRAVCKCGKHKIKINKQP